MTLAKVKNLYNQDFALWIEATVKQLKSGDLSQVDLENLIEEVESLGKSQPKAVDNFLTRLLEHLLKRCYVVLPDCYRGWEIEIRNFRKELKKEFKYSPSLKRFMIEILEECYREALEAVKEDYPDSNFPDVCPFAEDIDGLLNHKFWEDEKYVKP
ncbi:MAG: DUF29 domain-containing protein [Microcystis aeruginosa K13-05]|uniref:DUF29 domain-containing protein n=1 Tax=unclassified Microcystis TaxID=2643300 RepID=UPI0022BB3B7A|nr:MULTISPECIES: DUF29 domain-containing protein [unclassified Microcystis]MCZ8047393.1 DUF29 domain-containing protein [Microcystis sp. LE19-41.2A]MCZ8287489.1 DUF29 domain-containing protein [Microcystis sp. LE19-59.1C]NCR79271.1 DUF29 domain-containing protein [Microcystis aeruginosa K13-10]NCR83786.1 DUF29 domain-containing protein [Microcystis aeruginosa K13-05]